MLTDSGSNVVHDVEPTKNHQQWWFFVGDGGGSRLLGFRRGSNAGAMFRYQPEPRGGGQPEGSGDDPRGEADPAPGASNHLSIMLGFLLYFRDTQGGDRAGRLYFYG